MQTLAVLSRTSGFFIALALLLAPVQDAHAQSKRDHAAAEALAQRMTAAETRYRAAMVKVGNSDPDGIKESNAALEDMEDVVTACGKQRGCSLAQMLVTYKRLLKTNADAEAAVSDSEDFDETIVDDSDLPTGSVPQGASAASLLGEDGERFVRMVQFNPAVQAGIRRWLTDMRPSLMDSHENYQYMSHLMSPAFKRSGLPEALLFGILAKESNGKAHAGSRAGAVGPMQFMPATGRRFGLGVDASGFDTRYDPRSSADAAASYLNERFAEFGNDIEMWLAAYNGGEGRAARVYRQFGGRKFWEVDVYNQFPPETKDYVPMVIAAAWLYLHPKEYGVSFPRVDARPATFKLARTSSIYELTICLGSGGTRDGYMRVLRNLNPRYDADAWIPPGTVLNGTAKIASLYNRRCTKGERADLARQLVLSDADRAIVRGGAVKTVEPPVSTYTPDVSRIDTTVATGVPATPGKPRVHRVSRGDTLVSIAQQYACDAGVLARANDLQAPRYAIRSGQRLTLEGCRQ